MDTVNLKEHLDLLKMKDIKNLIRQYNLHYKIKLSQKKPELISDLLKHFEEYTINDNKITLKSKQYDFIKIDEPKPKAPRKPRIKKEEDKEDILQRLMKRNKDDDEKFEQEDKLIRQLIKEQNAIKKDSKGDKIKQLMKNNKDDDEKFEQEDKLIRQLIKEQNAIKKDKKEVIKEVQEDYNEEGYSIPKEINKSIRLFSGLKTNDDWKQTNTKVKAFYVKALKFLERANKEIHKKVYNASPDLFKKYYDKNKNNQIVLGRGLEMDSIN